MEEEILTQQTQLQELKDRMDRIAEKHRAQVAEARSKSGGGSSSLPQSTNGPTLEEKMVKAEVLKDVIQVINLFVFFVALFSPLFLFYIKL